MHTIKQAARQTGLSPHTIRAWERRYAALAPARTVTNRRLYSSEDMDKLSLLRRAVEAGHSIGQVAGLSVSELQNLPAIKDVSETARVEKGAASPAGDLSALYLAECFRAIAGMQADMLEAALTRAAAMLGATALMERVVLPLLISIGEHWREGEIRPFQEHIATAILRTFLGRTLASFQPSEQSPRLIVTTPAGQIHELGALIAAITAASEGWRVFYLGPNLPAGEIAGAARQIEAKAVALSIVYPQDDARLSEEFAALRVVLGQETPILVGGRAALAYQDSLEEIGVSCIADMPGLRRALEAIRSRQPVADIAP